MYPKYINPILKAIKKNIEANKSLKVFSDEYEAFYWWITEISIREFKEAQLFPINYEEEIKRLFNV